MIADSLRPFTTRASHDASAEGANEMVEAPALRLHGTTDLLDLRAIVDQH
jgi:hypothetical protein